MSEDSNLLPFCERGQGAPEGFPAESYTAGFRQADGTRVVEITLPAETIERAVLCAARLSLWLSLDGRLVLDGEGLSDEMLEAASAAGPLGQQTVIVADRRIAGSRCLGRRGRPRCRPGVPQGPAR